MSHDTMLYEKLPLATEQLHKSQMVARLQLIAGEAWGTEYATGEVMPTDAASALTISTVYHQQVDISELPKNLQRMWGELTAFATTVVDEAATTQYDWSDRASSLERLHRLVVEGEINPEYRNDVGHVMGWAARVTSLSMDHIPGDIDYYAQKVEYSLNLLDDQLRPHIPMTV